MTIYTFGDPELLREALLALATIFNLVDWSDPANPMGLGGNMLAVALIGLLAVGVAGVTKQEVRVDYLLVALIIFGIAFSSKVDVNVEDIQTGDSRVVADIPIGIAMVAAAASSAARELTEVSSLALQRPGVTTSVLTDSGFLDPLRHLLALRSLSFEELDEYANKSLLEFYKMCIGNTLATDPTLFNMNEFRREADSLGYMLNPARFINFATIYYTEANPAGIAVDCVTAANNLEGRLDVLTNGGDEAIAKIRLARGVKTYNEAFEFTDLDDAADIISRGVFGGQAFMEAAAMRNFINTAEAWRLTEYGTNEAQYVATVTEALESKKVKEATAGVVALQYFFPLMTFAQFLFFSIAPFMALIIIASPFTAAKALGMYLLFGVWAYSWMPIAAVINHYIQIVIGNTLEFSDIAAVGVQYTALTGIDSLYDQLSTKISIGGMALASTPVIVWALLTISTGGIASVIGNMSGVRQRANTSVSAPALAEGRPLVQAGGITSFRSGVQPTRGGMAITSSGAQDAAYGDGGASVAYSAGLAHANAMTNRASAELETSVGTLQKHMEGFTSEGGGFTSNSARMQTAAMNSLAKSLKGVEGAQELNRMGASQLNSILSRVGISTPVYTTGQTTHDGSSVESSYQKVMDHISENSAGFNTSFGEAMAQEFSNRTSEVGKINDSIEDIRKKQAELETARQAEQRISSQAQYVQQGTAGFSMKMTDIVTNGFAQSSDAKGLKERTLADVAGYLKADGYAIARERAWQKFQTEDGFVKGTDRLNDPFMDEHDEIITTALAVSEMIGKHDGAWDAYMSIMRNMGIEAGTSPVVDGPAVSAAHGVTEQTSEMLSATEKVTGSLSQGTFKSEDAMDRAVGEHGDAQAIRAEANRRRQQGSTAAEIPNFARSNIASRFEEYADNLYNTSNPAGFTKQGAELAANFNSMMTYVDATKAGIRQSDKLLTQYGNEVWQGDSGFKRSLERTVPAALKEQDPMRKDIAIMNSLGALNGELLFQHDIDFKAGERYQMLRDQGLSKDEALLGTYASVGQDQAGFGDYFATAVGSIVGYKAGAEWEAQQAAKAAKAGKAMPSLSRGLSFARFAGAGIGGVLATGAMVGMHMDMSKTQSENLQLMKDLFSREFQMMNPTMSEAFDKRIQSVENVEELIGAAMEFRDAGELTDTMLASIEDKRFGQATGWETPDHGGKTRF